MCSCVNQNIKSVKKLFLSPIFTSKKLHVVNYQKINISKFSFHSRGIIISYCLNNLISKLFAGGVNDFFIRVVFVNLVSNCLHQVSFTNTNRPVNKKRVVCKARFLCHGCCRNESQLVALRYGKCLKSI